MKLCGQKDIQRTLEMQTYKSFKEEFSVKSDIFINFDKKIAIILFSCLNVMWWIKRRLKNFLKEIKIDWFWFNPTKSGHWKNPECYLVAMDHYILGAIYNKIIHFWFKNVLY